MADVGNKMIAKCRLKFNLNVYLHFTQAGGRREGEGNESILPNIIQHNVKT